MDWWCQGHVPARAHLGMMCLLDKPDVTDESRAMFRTMFYKPAGSAPVLSICYDWSIDMLRTDDNASHAAGR